MHHAGETDCPTKLKNGVPEAHALTFQTPEGCSLGRWQSPVLGPHDTPMTAETTRLLKPHAVLLSHLLFLPIKAFENPK